MTKVPQIPIEHAIEIGAGEVTEHRSRPALLQLARDGLVKRIAKPVGFESLPCRLA